MGSPKHLGYEPVPDMLDPSSKSILFHDSPHVEFAGVITSNYNKTGILTGMETIIMKFLPYSLSYLLNIMISVVWPLKQLLVTQFIFYQQAMAEDVAENYNTYLFVSMGVPLTAKDMYKCLHEWFVINLQKDISMRDFRHISILFNHYHYRKLRALKEASSGSKDKEKATEEATGHKAQLGYAHYGRTLKYDGPFGEYGSRQKAYIICRDYHQRLGLPTTRSDTSVLPDMMAREEEHQKCVPPTPASKANGAGLGKRNQATKRLAQQKKAKLSD